MRATKGNDQLHLSNIAADGPSLAPQPRLGTRIAPHGPDADQWGPPVKRLLRIEQVLQRVPVSHSQLYNMIAAAKFPKQIHLYGGQSAFWVESEIEEYVQGQIDAERKAA